MKPMDAVPQKSRWLPTIDRDFLNQRRTRIQTTVTPRHISLTYLFNYTSQVVQTLIMILSIH